MGKRTKHIAAIAVVAGLSLLPLLALLVPGLPKTHDGPDHVARIANFYQSLTEGNVIPRWAGNLNWGYGHPILMFLYPLPSYMASLFHALGFSFTDSTKLVFAVAYTASMLAMYAWASSVWGKRAGIVAALLYGFAPYRFVDLYVRGAIGEHMAFVFPPLIMLGIHLSASVHPKKGHIDASPLLLSLSVAGMVLSHNAISLMFIPVAVLYAAYVYMAEAGRKTSFLLRVAIAAGAGFLLSAFFWIPAYFEGKYTLRDIVTKGEIGSRFVPFAWFFRSRWNYAGGNDLTKEVGIMQWLGVISAITVGWKNRGTVRWMAWGACLVLATSLFVMTKASGPLWNAIPLMQKFQFPWRFLSVSVFAAAVAGGVASSRIRLGNRNVVPVLTIIILVAATLPMWKPVGTIVRPEAYYSGIYDGTTDTGESSPIWSIRFMEHRYNEPMGTVTGAATITPRSRSSTRHEYEVNADTTVRLVENTVYFPGWTVSVDGRPVPIQFQDPAYRGLMTFEVPQGKHLVSVVFGRTKVRALSDTLSMITAILVLAYVAYFSIWKSR